MSGDGECNEKLNRLQGNKVVAGNMVGNALFKKVSEKASQEGNRPAERRIRPSGRTQLGTNPPPGRRNG